MHENLPNSVCEECMSNINKLYNFRKVIQNSDLELKERLQALENAKLTMQNINSEQLEDKTENVPLIKIEIQNDADDLIKNEEEINNQSEIPERPVKKTTPTTRSKSESARIRTSTYCRNNITLRGRPYFCKECNFSCTGHLAWKKHQQSKHFECATCKICGRILRKENLSKHIKNHSNGHVCKECGESFRNYENLRTHTYERHKGSELHCELCGKVFYYHGDLNRHVKHHCKCKLLHQYLVQSK